MPKKIGQYTVRTGNTKVKFWPLVPGTNVTQASGAGCVAPNSPQTCNTLAPLALIGIFDIVIEMSEGVLESDIENEKSTDLLGQVTVGTPTIDTMPLILDPDAAQDTPLRI